MALPRAQVLAIVVASPALGRTRCSSLDQMKAVKVYCKAIHAAQHDRVLAGYVTGMSVGPYVPLETDGLGVRA